MTGILIERSEQTVDTQRQRNNQFRASVNRMVP
jgi:hypothetical protein